MNRSAATRLIKIITAVWVVLGLIIAGSTFAKWISLDLFQIIFPIGFFIWVVAVVVLTQFINTGEK
ncbi:MAG: hypothetical protein QNK37_34950 [Acidobacteriota bacterium]|nr:hypothetical protein [Acidobacteriota bacterium]